MARPIVILFLLGLVGSCVSIDGGAVEASWVIRSDDGRAITECGCADPAISQVRFELVGDAPSAIKGTRPCQDRAACRFSCQHETGATPFDIPEGRYAISIVPLDAAGLDLTQLPQDRHPVRVPAPIVRDVMKGQPTEIAALLIRVANCAESCSGMNENKVCARP